MSALSVIGSNLMDSSMAPLSLTTGATSESDPDAGSTASTDPADNFSKITTKDKAGASILTILMVVFVVGGAVWIVL